MNTMHPHSSQNETHSLFVGDLPPDCNDEKLQRLFQQKFKSVKRAQIIRHDDGSSRCFGFIRFEDRNELQAALSQEMKIGNVCLRLDMANEYSRRKTRSRYNSFNSTGNNHNNSNNNSKHNHNNTNHSNTNHNHHHHQHQNLHQQQHHHHNFNNRSNSNNNNNNNKTNNTDSSNNSSSHNIHHVNNNNTNTSHNNISNNNTNNNNNTSNTNNQISAHLHQQHNNTSSNHSRQPTPLDNNLNTNNALMINNNNRNNNNIESKLSSEITQQAPIVAADQTKQQQPNQQHPISNAVANNPALAPHPGLPQTTHGSLAQNQSILTTLAQPSSLQAPPPQVTQSNITIQTSHTPLSQGLHSSMASVPLHQASPHQQQQTSHHQPPNMMPPTSMYGHMYPYGPPTFGYMPTQPNPVIPISSVPPAVTQQSPSSSAVSHQHGGGSLQSMYGASNNTAASYSPSGAPHQTPHHQQVQGHPNDTSGLGMIPGGVQGHHQGAPQLYYYYPSPLYFDQASGAPAPPSLYHPQSFHPQFFAMPRTMNYMEMYNVNAPNQAKNNDSSNVNGSKVAQAEQNINKFGSDKI